MEGWKRMLLANKAWVADKLAVRPDYFVDLAKEQRPEFLWIGCSDSRVPAEEITGTTPGELFVHRNIANLVVHTDLNLLSVLQFAVDHLKVQHVIVCGHYGCGGVKAAMTHQRYGLMNKWLRHIKDTYSKHHEQISMYEDPRHQVDRLVEFNVIEQVQNLVKTSIIQRAWVMEQRPVLHGWVYGLDDGLIKPLVQVNPGAPIPEVYRFDFSQDRSSEG